MRAALALLALVACRDAPPPPARAAPVDAAAAPAPPPALAFVHLKAIGMT